MHNLAYKIDAATDKEILLRVSIRGQDSSDVCAACGERLFGPDAEACSWQAWGTFWEILGMSSVELVCGACGEYLRAFFREDRK